MDDVLSRVGLHGIMAHGLFLSLFTMDFLFVVLYSNYLVYVVAGMLWL
jgi:hypothetical protein